MIFDRQTHSRRKADRNMAMQNLTPILHQYEVSPYSEKVRLAFGLKGLTWQACNQPVIMPKPELLALTGAYRRIPVMQIGADIYCDSELVLDEIERRFDGPDLFAPSGRLANRAIQQWADAHLFPTIVGLLFADDWEYDAAFAADRAALNGRPFDPEAFRAASPMLTARLQGLLALIEAQLSDDRPFLFGDGAGAADLQVAHNIIFVRWGKGRTAQLLASCPRLSAWADRIVAIGHGERSDIDRNQAIAIAREASRRQTDGPMVRFRTRDADATTIEGRLVGQAQGRVSILIHTAEAGDVTIHLPEAGVSIA